MIQQLKDQKIDLELEKIKIEKRIGKKEELKE